MAAPTRAAWGKLKRLVRYLLQFPRLSWTFKRDECETDTIDVFSDSEWAGCVRTRRSTSGGVVTIGGSAIKHWSLTQATVAFSSGEAEHLALVRPLARESASRRWPVIWGGRCVLSPMSTPALHDPSRIDRAWKTPAHRDESSVRVRSVQGGGQGQPRRHSHEADVVGRDACKAQRYWGHCSCSRRA